MTLNDEEVKEKSDSIDYEEIHEDPGADGVINVGNHSGHEEESHEVAQEHVDQPQTVVVLSPGTS